MTHENQGKSGSERLRPNDYPIEVFTLDTNKSQAKWRESVWPQLQRLIMDAWPESATPENEAVFADLLNSKGSMVLLMRAPHTGELIGASFIESVKARRTRREGTSYPRDSQSAFNHTVIIDSRYRQQGLVIPLLERQMEEASHIGYTYMVGRYNANKGMMPDGRHVTNGFASKLLQHKWQNGRVLLSSPEVGFDASGKLYYQEFIAFQLNPKMNISQGNRQRFPAPALAHVAV